MGALTQHQVEVAQQQSSSPGALLVAREQEMREVMPTHVPQKAWLRQANAAVNAGKVIQTRNGPQYQLAVAALNNPEAFLSAIRRAASLGLVPGTEQFYLTPRRVNGQEEILGIIGYQGYIELMYNGGFVSSVIVDTVHENDGFEFVRGRDEYPIHTIDYRKERKDEEGNPLGRGKIQLVYAFAKMHSGATSQVIVLDEEDIALIKSKAQGANSDYSPWKTHTKAMWMKSAVRQLQKWVPWSVERQQAVGISHDIPVAAVGAAPPPTAAAAALPYDGHAQLQSRPGQVIVGQVLDESDEDIVDTDTKDVSDLPEAEPEEPAAPTVERMNPNQGRTIANLFKEKGIENKEARGQLIKQILQIEGVFTPDDMTSDQAKIVIAELRSAATPASVRQAAEEGPPSEEDAAVDRLAEEAERESAS